MRIPAFVIVFPTVFLGSGSLFLLGIFLFAGSFQLVNLNLGTAAALGLDAALCLLFFFQHSGMVRKRFRQILKRFLPLHYHSAFYTLASAGTLMVLLVFWQNSGIVLLHFEGGLYWSVKLVFVSGVVGFIWGLRALESFDAFGIRTILSRRESRPARVMPLSIRGPYRRVRHPLYFFTLVMVWSCPLITADRMLFNIIFTLWIVIATKLEERDLVSEFGSAYQKYQRKVPMLIPWRIHLWFGSSVLS